MDFPIDHLLNEQACYDWLVELLHPEGLCCPDGHPLTMAGIHKRAREPLISYCCWGPGCGRVYNAFTGTMWQGAQWKAKQIVLLLRGVAQGVSTNQLSREIGIDYKWVLARRHQLQKNAASVALAVSPPRR